MASRRTSTRGPGHQHKYVLFRSKEITCVHIVNQTLVLVNNTTSFQRGCCFTRLLKSAYFSAYLSQTCFHHRREQVFISGKDFLTCSGSRKHQSNEPPPVWPSAITLQTLNSRGTILAHTSTEHTHQVQD